MRTLAHSKSHWLIGPEGTTVLERLWARYQSVYLGQGLQPALQTLTYPQLRLVSLGVPPEKAGLQNTNAPTFISDRQSLNAIQQSLTDASGRPLQKIMSDDIGSRVYVEANTSLPDAARWCEEAIDLLGEVVPHHAHLFARMISWIIPIYHEKYGRPFRRAFSHVEYLGALFTTFVERSSQPAELRRTILAADFSHELGHQSLMLYQLTDKVLLDYETPIYSSVRKVERPAIMALHACVAAAYMMEVFSAVVQSGKTSDVEKQFAENSLLDLCEHQRTGIESLSRGAQFTTVGQSIWQELTDQLNAVTEFDLTKATENSRLSYFGLLAP